MNCKKKVTITCETHGNFEQTPSNHLWGFECSKCASENMSSYLRDITEEFIRKASGSKPIIDLNKNVDSAAEILKEREIIGNGIRSGTFDTTGTANGVFYNILKEGTGENITVNDTLFVRYKGSLMNGMVFDETKDKPAIFTLKRLIRGWQFGLPFCKAGGKIRLIIPSYLGYSIRNLGNIPPNSILIFDIEVLELRKGRP